MTGSDYLSTKEVATYLGVSKRTIHARMTAGRIPHRILPYGRAALFVPDEINAYVDGAALETIELEGGGRIVRPVQGAA